MAKRQSTAIIAASGRGSGTQKGRQFQHYFSSARGAITAVSGTAEGLTVTRGPEGRGSGSGSDAQPDTRSVKLMAPERMSA